MKRLLYAVLSAALMIATGTTTFAQDGPPQFRPVELWACQYNEGMDQGDMEDVYEMIASDSGDTPYAAYHLVPYFVGTRIQQFDFLYLGAWANSSAMGADLAGIFAGDLEAEEAWGEVATCGGTMFASLRIQEPPSGGAGDNFILTVQDCKAGKGVSNGQALGAVQDYNEFRVANGQTTPSFAWFPVAGDGNADAEFDFKVAHAYQDAQAWGDANQWVVDNMAYQDRSRIMDGVVACDESRVYVGTTLMDNMNQ